MPNLRTLPSLVLALLAIALTPIKAGANVLVQFHMPIGSLLVELYDNDKPETVKNFLRYIQDGRYQGSFVQRWAPNFVIQGGGFSVTNIGRTNASINAVSTYGNIVNEYGVGRTLSNTYGTLAMARVGGQTNSASSQWFINTTNNVFLDGVDGGFTVFGKVLEGTNVLNRFNNPVVTNGIWSWNLGGALATLPALSANAQTFYDLHDDLLYLDFTVIGATVALGVEKTAGGGRSISWDSVGGKINHVEFSTSVPPTWQTLASPTGTGSRMTVADTNSTDPVRVYRVRIQY